MVLKKRAIVQRRIKLATGNIIVGTQKICLNVIDLLSTQNKCEN